MDPSKTLSLRDVVSYLGRDYLIEGVVTYRLAGKTHVLGRAVDGDAVLWVGPPGDEADERLLLLTEVHDVDIVTPPPPSISYRKSVFLPRFSGRAQVELSGQVPGQASGARDVWRYRAAGDLFLQIESRAGATAVLYGESVHKGMIDILPGR